MEDVKVLEWIENNSNCGYGSGIGCGSGTDCSYNIGSAYGSAYGSGSGYGSGIGCGYDSGIGCSYNIGTACGSAYGSGSGYGSGYGYGSDFGYGIKSFNCKNVYVIDNVKTIISTIKGNLAKGFILNTDFSLLPCYICKSSGYFSHGETLKEAREALQKKIFENMNSDEAIERFLSTFEKEKKYPAKDFYDWHHYLTGSCEMGRKAFMRDKNITFDDMYTVDEFIVMCEDSYGGEIIKQLKEKWNKE